MLLCLRMCSFTVRGPRRSTMSHYKYVMVVIMGVLFLYSLTIDVAYPYVEQTALVDHLMRLDDEIVADDDQSEKKVGAQRNVSTTKFCDIYNLTRGYDAKFECVNTRTSPSAVVCLHPVVNDMYISHDLKETGMWEPHLVPDFQEALRKDPELGVIDVGANIGFYTMLAASMGHKVVAVEPFYSNIYRIHRSVALTNSYSSVTIVHNAVSNQRVKGTIKGSGNNQGDVRIKPFTVPCVGSCPQTVDVILLNDLLEVITFDRALLKLDIQGYEHKAMSKVTTLLDHVNVEYIFMEWGVMKDFYLEGNKTSTNKFLVEEMIHMLFLRQYRPYALSGEGGKPLNTKDWNAWPFDVIWRKLPDEEDLGGAMRNHFIHWP